MSSLSTRRYPRNAQEETIKKNLDIMLQDEHNIAVLKRLTDK
jgi:hypothetical protein